VSLGREPVCPLSRTQEQACPHACSVLARTARIPHELELGFPNPSLIVHGIPRVRPSPVAREDPMNDHRRIREFVGELVRDPVWPRENGLPLPQGQTLGSR